MNGFRVETARGQSPAPMDVLQAFFSDILKDESGSGSSYKTYTDALFLDAGGTRVFGVCGLPCFMPVCAELINKPGFSEWLREQKGSILIADEGDHIRAYEVCTPDAPAVPAEISINAASAVREAEAALAAAPGTFNENGELILDIKAPQVGLHYPVNLLLGDRSGFEFPLVTTPKSAVDSLGRGSFRAAGGDQVLATRYTLNPEENGEPANRQFYLFEGGKQIFWSADIRSNVESGTCRHSQNRTVISYKTEDGLEITRTIFILPQEEGMPEAAEAQRITVKNNEDRDRALRIVATGVFGMQGPGTLATDVVYANLVAETALMKDGDRPAALALNSKPAEDRLKRRFAMLLTDGETMDEFCNNLTDFIGNGSLARPEHADWLSCTLQRKMASFFALAKSVTVPAGETVTVDVFTGLCYAGGPVSASADAAAEAYKADPAKASLAEREADDKIFALYRKYTDPAKLDEVLSAMDESWCRYTSYLRPETEDPLFNAYVQSDLPFQVLYQTYVSRAFAWTQKAYRETGFREIQDIYASMYYMSAAGNNSLIRELIGSWVRNVWEMGYANHNFTFRGKEPGDCSDDQLWLIQAVYRYVHLTGDTEFLHQEFEIAGSDKKRTLWQTVRAILTYSGMISVGKHGLPLLDKADWNDTLRLDNGVLQGPAKESAYMEQLERSGKEYGVPFENDQCESIMNAFLLKIAADETAELAKMTGDADMEKFAGEISGQVLERCRKYAWKGDYYARCLINDGREFTYIGADGDRLSADPDVPGSYFLNSYSWAVLAGAADEDQIRIMLDRVNKYLRTDAGLKLCTLIDFSRLGINTGTAFYFPGDRENCGVFKHAAMMAAVASMKAAKKVSDPALASDLRELAFFMLDKTLPYRTLEDPFVQKGNPRFCTQYNNSETGENIGPMLSGTASWLTLGIYEFFGIDVRKDEIAFDPLLRPGEHELKFTVCPGGAVLHVTVTGDDRRYRVGTGTEFKVNGRPFDGILQRPDEGEWDITITL